MSNYDHYDDDKNSDDEYGGFLDMIPQIRLMVRDILLNPAPIAEQPHILKKLMILNYALGEWNDAYDRSAETVKEDT
jgi:hypothetical protein